MKNLFICVAVLLLSLSVAFAGIVSDSPYDKVWDIEVMKCNGDTVTYENCVITNLDEWSLSFIPDQGRIPTGNRKEVMVHRNSCTTITLFEK